MGGKLLSCISLLFSSLICFYGFLFSMLQYLRLWISRRSIVTNPLNFELCNSIEGDKISIVIAVKNEAKFLGKTIRNLETSTIDKTKVEIILVDGGCQDNSIAVAKSSSGAIPIIYGKATHAGSSRGVALNAGFELISGNIVLFIKADSLLPPGYDEVLRRTFCGDTILNNETSSVLYASFKMGNSYLGTTYPPIRQGQHATSSNKSQYEYNDLRTRARSSSFNNDQMQQSTELSYLHSQVLSLRVIDFFANIRAKLLKLPVTGQCLAMNAHLFRQRKFKEDIILEDLELVERLRRDVLSNTSSRKLQCIQLDPYVMNAAIIGKYMTLGIAKYTLLEQLSVVLFICLKYATTTIYSICYCVIPKYTRWVRI